MFITQNKLSVVCPIYTNDGRELAEHIGLIREELACITGGASQFVQRGVWFDGLDKYDEPSTVLYTLCNDEQLDELSTRFETWARTLEQIELLITVEPIKTAFISGVKSASLSD